MGLGDGVGRNKSAKHWINSRQRDYFKGVEDFSKWLLSNEKYTACQIDTDENCIFSDVGLTEDNYIISIPELLEEFKSSLN